MKEETAEKLKRGRPAKRKGDTVRKPITEKQREARRKNCAKVGKTVGAGIREAKAKTQEVKARTFAKPTYTSPVLMAYRIAKYFHYMDSMEWENSGGKHIGKPYTDAGIDLALGIDRVTATALESGSIDHVVTEQLDGGVVVSTTGIQYKHIKDIEPEILPYVLYLLGNPDYTFSREPITIETAEAEALQEWGMGIFFSVILQKARQTVQFQRELSLYDKGRTADIFALKAKDGWQDEQRVTYSREITTSAEAAQLLEQFARLPQIE